MDLVTAVWSSDEEDMEASLTQAEVADSDNDGEPYGSARDFLPVGKRIALPSFRARCLGDDVSWKGGQTLLVIALQSGSTGVERMQWGLWWGEFLRQLGADIACVSKAGIRPWQHDLDCRGMKEADFAAVSHGPTESLYGRGCSSQCKETTLATGK